MQQDRLGGPKPLAAAVQGWGQPGQRRLLPPLCSPTLGVLQVRGMSTASPREWGEHLRDSRQSHGSPQHCIAGGSERPCKVPGGWQCEPHATPPTPNAHTPHANPPATAQNCCANAPPAICPPRDL